MNNKLLAIEEAIEQLWKLADKARSRGDEKTARELEVHVRDYLLDKRDVIKEVK